jgi:WhiB family transcriptional regulator, redox-sensing transcriptional regulator
MMTRVMNAMTEPWYEIEYDTWRDGAACADLGDEVDFFPSPEDTPAIARAKAVCASCPVAEDCLAYAFETKQGDGIWGGLTPAERIKLRRRWLEDARKAS